MKIEYVSDNKERGRIKCRIDGTYYDLPKGLYKKLKEDKSTKTVYADKCMDCPIDQIKELVKEIK